MSDLTYLGLRCILEYLELNKRLHIISRSSTLHEVDKSIPVHVNDLCFFNNGIRINKISYEVGTKMERIGQSDPRCNELLKEQNMTPGDFLVKAPDDKWQHKMVKFETPIDRDRKRSAFKLIPCGLKPILKHLTTGLLGYKTIFVDYFEFEFDGTIVLRLPENFKVYTRKLNSKNHDISAFLPLLDPSCFPLKEVHYTVKNTLNVKHPVLENSEAISTSGPQITSEHVEFSLEVWEDEVGDVIEQVRNFKKPIGSSYKMNAYCMNRKSFESVSSRFGGEFNNLIGYLSKKGMSSYDMPSYCVTIPMDSTTEINVYKFGLGVNIDVTPIGSAKPLPIYDCDGCCQRMSLTEMVENAVLSHKGLH